MMIIIQSTDTKPLHKQHAVDAINFKDKETHKHNSHQANSGNSTAEKLLFLRNSTKKNARTTRTRKTIPINNNNNNNSVMQLLISCY
jgi:hypothetical protein